MNTVNTHSAERRLIKQTIQNVAHRAVESEVPSSDSDSWQFRLSGSDSNSDLQLY